jgi:hypothetical protein
VDVAAGFADETHGGGVGPVEIEEGHGGGVELGFAAVEFVVAADLAFQNVAVDFVGFGFGFLKESHGWKVAVVAGAAIIKGHVIWKRVFRQSLLTSAATELREKATCICLWVGSFVQFLSMRMGALRGRKEFNQTGIENQYVNRSSK